MQIEVYRMTAEEDALTITLEAVCDTFSSLLWDVEYYKCGSFEVYIAANPQNIEIFQTGRIVGRDDDNQHFGIIESVLINTDIENGDYLTVRGRFLMCLLDSSDIQRHSGKGIQRYCPGGRDAECTAHGQSQDSGAFPRNGYRLLLGADSYAADLIHEPDAMGVYDL